jgi:Arc/MetJ family transcription regulator
MDIQPMDRENMAFRKTSIEVDEGLLNRAREALGTTTIRETVEQAFLEVLRERARRDEVHALTTMRGMDLDDPKVMAKAWRS